MIELVELIELTFDRKFNELFKRLDEIDGKLKLEKLEKSDSSIAVKEKVKAK